MVIDDDEKVRIAKCVVKHCFLLIYKISNYTIFLNVFYRRNVGYASTSNSVGLPIGMFLGSVCFTLLVSEESGETYLGKKPGTGPIVTMKSM